MSAQTRVRREGARGRSAGQAQPRLPGLRWLPVPLAVLVAVVGWLVFGSLQGQSAASAAHQHGLRAGGLELTVQQMGWMSNDMTGEGPIKNAKGFSMPSSEMPGMQTVGDDRLQLDVTLQNITGSVQTYHLNDFRIIGKGGKSWPIVNDGSATATSGIIEPNFSVTVAVYFDIPSQDNKDLSIEWSRGGGKVEFPVNTSSAPAAHVH